MCSPTLCLSLSGCDPPRFVCVLHYPHLPTWQHVPSRPITPVCSSLEASRTSQPWNLLLQILLLSLPLLHFTSRYYSDGIYSLFILSSLLSSFLQSILLFWSSSSESLATTSAVTIILNSSNSASRPLVCFLPVSSSFSLFLSLHSLLQNRYPPWLLCSPLQLEILHLADTYKLSQ